METSRSLRYDEGQEVRSMLVRLSVVALVLLAGCSHATLPYQPDPQPRGGRVSAAYQVVGDRLRVEIETSGKPLEQAWIIRPGGASVAPIDVELPPVVTGPPPTISIGVGGASYGRGVGVGSDVGVGVPIGSGPTRTQGNAIVWFALAQAGPAPWQLYVKLVGVEPAQFAVGGPLPQ
jgi:hypothetical protein